MSLDEPSLPKFSLPPAQRAIQWKLRTQSLDFPARPRLMGIVNVTPDSFSDGGKFLDPADAIEHGLRLVEAGADLLDIGGESTRPNAAPVSVDEELCRVMPVVDSLCRMVKVPISIDTRHAEVAREAMATGAEIINDVSGLTGDSAMLEVARETEAGLCVMHMQGTPATMQKNPTYGNVVEEVFDYLCQRRDVLVAAGIDPQRICLDPGIGFGKTCQHNLALLTQCQKFHALGQPLLVGPSRKGFLGEVLGNREADRTAATIGVALALATQGVQILRIHDVQEVQDALQLFAATGGL